MTMPKNDWEKMFALLLWKTSKLSKVVITPADVESFPMDRVLSTHGSQGMIGFQLVDAGAAEKIAQVNGVDIRKIK